MNNRSAAISAGEGVSGGVPPVKDDSAAILGKIRDGRESVCLRGTRRTALAYLLAGGLEKLNKTILLVAPSDKEAERFGEMIAFFRGRENGRSESFAGRQVLVLPSRTGHKAQALGKSETTARRVEALYALSASQTPRIVATSALALMERLLPPEVLSANTEYLVKGEPVDPEALCARLAERGYCPVSLVEEYGDFSRRGGILDIYSPLYPRPLRLELFGDELEAIRFFHPSSQRSLGILDDVTLLPGSEIILDGKARERAIRRVYDEVRKERITPAAGNVWIDRIREGQGYGAFDEIYSAFYEETVTLLDYLDPGSVVVWSDAVQVRGELEERYWGFGKAYRENLSPNEWKLPPEELFEAPEAIFERCGRFRQVLVNPLTESCAEERTLDMGSDGLEELVRVVKDHGNRERLLEPLAARFNAWKDEGIGAFLVCRTKEQARRLTELLEGYGVDAIFSAQPFGEDSFESPSVKVLAGSLDKGFVWPAERLAVVAEEEIFGKRPGSRRKKSAVAGLFLNSFQDLHVGDFVVHVDHGIGIYRELAHLDVRGIEHDFLLLEYQDGDRLYVPVDKLGKVQKYLGVEGNDPRVDKLGGKSWEAAKKKASEAAERIAEELLQLYAARGVREGHRFSVPDAYFHEFEATFVYEETPDQMSAIEDVLEDMASPRPMDRLICGDVGYGKTEVALRAAFKAAMDNKQVALLVPTTVLAEQHYQTFLERFEGFPVTVESLSRFKTPAQQKQVVEGLRKGTVDVVVGTHRLLQKDVVFKDLGLLIVDEEHRFGVKNKEKLKQLRIAVDVLTLTATPIPRTLHMSLAGIRDLSTIETPPQDRRAIETVVCKYDELTVKEAVYRELNRGGQVFFVHNHVQSIYQVAANLGRLVPEARIGVAHGQMKEHELEKAMLDFVGRKTNILVCTTIIESGLDIPAANTIVVNRADRFGLAQIYQLRGRVGRGGEQAYAYLLIPGEELISRDAQKRLRALMDFSELGAGFKIALNDLQIRGGGTILGASQSGHIAAVGYELYLDLLDRTIRQMKGDGGPATAVFDPEINVPLSAFLPDAYMPDADQRLVAYKRLATAGEDAEVDNLAGEWRDRYGPFPESVRSLLLLAKTRLLFMKIGIMRLDGGEGDRFALHFFAPDRLERTLSVLDAAKASYVIETDRKIRLEIWGRSAGQRLSRLKRILQEVADRVTPGETGQQVE